MGRWYCGDIEGKFAFGIQDSDDASYFGVDYEDVMSYYVCGCIYEEGINEKYCDGCYESFEEHLQAVHENEDNTFTECIERFPSQIKYNFQSKHIEQIEEKLEDLFNKLADDYDFDWDCLDFQIDGDNYDVSWSVEEDIGEGAVELIYRWCLGKQILHCLKTKGECSFVCDLE
jgi:hypothetical protein